MIKMKKEWEQLYLFIYLFILLFVFNMNRADRQSLWDIIFYGEYSSF